MPETGTRAETFALIPAAGAGIRMGSVLPKPLLTIDSQTVLERVLAQLAAADCFAQLVVVYPAQHRAAFEALANGIEHSNLKIHLVEGGATRQQSVSNGAEYLARHFTLGEHSYVLVHDAARCFVTPEIVRRAISAAQEAGAVTVAIPVVDTVVRVDEHYRIAQALDRTGVWQIQTPQVFRADLLLRAHRESSAEQRAAATDDAGLVRLFHPVQVVLGDVANRKVTTPADLAS